MAELRDGETRDDTHASRNAAQLAMAESEPPKVYLAGPIDNVDDAEAKTWREQAGTVLGNDAEVVDPHRECPVWPQDLDERRELREWCFEQARACDVVLVGNLGPETVSRGTAMEIREAEVAGTPIVVQSPQPELLSNFVGIAAASVYQSLTEAGRHTLGLVRSQSSEVESRA